MSPQETRLEALKEAMAGKESISRIRELVADLPQEVIDRLVKDHLVAQVCALLTRLQDAHAGLEESLGRKVKKPRVAQTYAITMGVLQDKLIQAMRELGKLDRVTRAPLGVPTARPGLRVVDGAE